MCGGAGRVSGWGRTCVWVGPDACLGGARRVSGWGQMRVWVGPVTWGVIEGHHWGSGTLLWGLGYMVQPGDMVGCMECMRVLLQGGPGIVHAVQYANDILVGVRVIVSW